MYVSESRLETMVLNLVAAIKATHACWANPEALAGALNLEVRYGPLGGNREGACQDTVIVIDPAKGTAARRRFTWYHELTHALIRRDDELYAILDEQYRREEDLIRIREYLSNIGAAEFILPREQVRAMLILKGYSIGCLEALSDISGASWTAASVQIARCSPHRCIVVVCQSHVIPASGQALLSAPVTRPVLRVAIGMPSPRMPYPIARDTIIPAGHLLVDAYRSAEGKVVRGEAPIPFKSGKEWVVPCEAVRLGEQIFAIFQADPPPIPNQGQMTLF